MSFPEAAILLVSDGNRDLWPGPAPEVRDSRTSRRSAHAQSQVWQIWLVLVSIYCVYTDIQNQNVVGPGQGCRYFQRMTKGTPGDEVDDREDGHCYRFAWIYDLGDSVTPTFLFRNRFYLQWATHCPKMNKNWTREVKMISRFLSTAHRILPSCDCKVRETMVAKFELVKEPHQLTKFT